MNKLDQWHHCNLKAGGQQVFEMDYKGRGKGCKTNTDIIHSKCQQRLFFLRKLQVHQSVLTAFYRCFIESIITFNITSWFGALSNINRNPLNRIIKLTSKIIGQQQESLINIYNKRTKQKSTQITLDITHTLHSQYSLLPSGRRYRAPTVRTNRALSSFVPASIRLLNGLTPP